MIKKFRKKPIVIEAIQWNGNTNRKEINAFVGKELEMKEFSMAAYEAGQGPPSFSLFIETLEGKMEAIPNDWIIKGIEGEFYPCKSDIFEKCYEEVEVAEEPLECKAGN